jgi:hypothetical protein
MQGRISKARVGFIIVKPGSKGYKSKMARLSDNPGQYI